VPIHSKEVALDLYGRSERVTDLSTWGGKVPYVLAVDPMALNSQDKNQKKKVDMA
jgi:hypothetical protein